MEQLYDKYLNIQKFISYRKYELRNQDRFLEYEDFKNKMQLTGYIQHNVTNTRTSGKVDLYLFKKDSKHIKTTPEFIKLLDKYREPFHIILFTKEPLSIYLKKAIHKYPDLKIDNFLHKHFIIELNKGPLCATHTILSPEETRQVCFDLMTHGHKLPAISINDPQNIWIGGEINDVIKIEANSELTGRTIRYRIVTPISGKIEQSDDIKKIDTSEGQGDE